MIYLNLTLLYNYGSHRPQKAEEWIYSIEADDLPSN